MQELLKRGLSHPNKVTRPEIDARQPPKWFHEGQLRAWSSSAIDTIACAGTQGGKTASEAPWLLREIQRSAPLIRSLGFGKFIYAGPSLQLLKDQAIPLFRELFQETLQLGRLIEGGKPEFRFSESGLRKLLGFTNCKVTVTFAYTNDSANLESMTAQGGIWDEAGQKDNRYESYGAYNRRLKVARSTTFGSIADFAPDWWREWYGDAEGTEAVFGRRLWGTTPYEWNWFKTEVVDRAERGEPGFAFCNWPSWMNPRVSEAECRAELDKGAPLWRWEMMYLGLFKRPAGIIYDTFDWHADTCDDFTIPANWKIYPGVDFGSANTGAVNVAEDPATKTLYVVSEYKQGGRTFREHADAIKSGRGLQVGAGGSHQEEGWREAFRSAGLPLDEPPTNNVNVQIGCVYSVLKTHSLKVFRSCKGLIEQFQGYSRELGSDGQPTEVIANKASYHILDALRYVVTKLRPPMKAVGKTPGYDPLSFLVGVNRR